MSNLAYLSPSPYESSEKGELNKNDSDIIEKKKKTKISKKLSKGVKSMMDEIHNNSNDENTNMGDFVPPPEVQSKHDEPVQNVTSYNELESSEINDYYKTVVPNYSINNLKDTSKDALIEKLDNILHLLEEQKDEKTGHVTEEVILYSFVGVFIIFVCDSFARVGKYVR